jgi:hypothetical protein
MKSSKVPFLSVALVLLAWPVLGQTLTGSVVGTVRDEQGAPLSGATVTLLGKTGSTKTAADNKGAYRFPSVDPGLYAVRAEFPQFQALTQDNVAITISRQLTVDFALKIARVAETVDVRGEAQVVDVTSSAQTEGLSQEILFNFPVTRFAQALLNYAPGINGDSAFGGGDASNGFYLDGVSTRSPGGGSDYIYMNYDVIEDFQVLGLGAPAEYGNFTGAIINYVSRSGGNDFGALFDARYSTRGLGASNVTPGIVAQNPFLGDPQKTIKLLDVTAQLSGPIVKDRLFFFVGMQRYELNAKPPGPRTSLNEVTPRLNAKLTYQPTPSDTLTAAFQGEDYNRTGRSNFYAGANATTDALSLNEDGPDRLWTVQWRHLFGSGTFLEAKYHGYTAKDYLDPRVAAPIHFDSKTGVYSGGGGYFDYSDRQQHTVQASISHYAEAFGHHDFKFGVEIERSRARDRSGYTGGLYFYDYNGAPYRAYSYSYDVTGDNHRTSFYAQDSWKVNDRLTINPGLRLDILHGINPASNKTVYSTTNLAPRFGIAYDLTGDHKTALRAFYGQYYEALLEYQYYRLLPGTSDRVTFDMTGPAPVEISRDPLSNLAYRIDPNIKHPKVEEFIAAFERALTGEVRLSVTGVVRNNRNFIGSVIPSARWIPTTVTNALTGQPLLVYTWANKDQSANDLLITNPDGFVFKDPNGQPLGTTEASARYRGLIVSLERRRSKRWQAKVSYVLSQNKGTVDPFSGEHIGYGRQFETPTLALLNASGSFIASRPHEFKVFLGYDIPKIEVSLNAYYRHISGETYTPFQRFSSSVINFGALVGREPNLEPLGLERLPAESLLDLRAEKVFKVRGGRLGVYADIFNLFNASLINGVQNRVPSSNGILYGSPDSIVEPRQVTFGARWSF